jgi:UDP-galactopyranose mutase
MNYEEVNSKVVPQPDDINYDCIVIGAGFAGATVARELAERGSKRVLLLEKREHIGGNAYDCMDKEGILIHKHGPHIFHTNNHRVYAYLSRFTEWRIYQHRVLASIHGKLIPVPFNLKSLSKVFGKVKARKLRDKLIATYGSDKKVSIGELKKQEDPDLQELAEYVYQNIFLHYTQKQWGARPENIDPAVTARVPILISEDDRYFQDVYQGIPLEGYTALFENMLNHPNIETHLNADATDMLKFTHGRILFNDTPFSGRLIYTGPIDELFGCCFGRLPYRTLEFKLATYNIEWKQPCGTINYTVDKPYTRITEFKHLTGQERKDKTTTMKEYSLEYHGFKGEIPYYPIVSPESCQLYNKYIELTKTFPGFHTLGRLAEYKYYNMDAIVEQALELADRLISQPDKK